MELVALKGTGDGVKIYLSPTEDFSKITQALHIKLDEFRGFFRKGHCNIYVIGRELSASDKMRIEAIISAVLPDSTVNYGERKIFGVFRKENREETEPAHEAEEAPEEPAEKPREDASEKTVEDELGKLREEIEDEIEVNFKRSRARYFHGTVKAGMVVSSECHLMFLGDVEEGGKLSAAGNIFVMGRVCGEIETTGSNNAYIAALELSPTKITIAGRTLENPQRPEEEKSEPARAYLINNEIKIEKFWLK